MNPLGNLIIQEGGISHGNLELPRPIPSSRDNEERLCVFYLILFEIFQFNCKLGVLPLRRRNYSLLKTIFVFQNNLTVSMSLMKMVRSKVPEKFSRKDKLVAFSTPISLG